MSHFHGWKNGDKTGYGDKSGVTNRTNRSILNFSLYINFIIFSKAFSMLLQSYTKSFSRYSQKFYSKCLFENTFILSRGSIRSASRFMSFDWRKISLDKIQNDKLNCKSVLQSQIIKNHINTVDTLFSIAKNTWNKFLICRKFGIISK